MARLLSLCTVLALLPAFPAAAAPSQWEIVAPADRTALLQQMPDVSREPVSSAPAELRSAEGMVAALARTLPQPGTGNGANAFGEAVAVVGIIPAFEGVGDLDGDGRDDVGLTLYDDEGWERTGLRALRGTDGATLWDFPLPDASIAFFAGADLDGDGATDLLTYAVTRYEVLEEQGCEQYGTCERYRAEFTWQIDARSGRDLRVLWTRSHDGSVDETDTRRATPPAEQPSYHYEVRNQAAGLPLVFAQGGTPAILDMRTDYVERDVEEPGTLPVVTSLRSWTRRWTHRLTAVGPGGAAVSESVLGPSTASTHVRGASDLDGDGNDELVAEETGRADASESCLRLVLHEPCTYEGGGYSHGAVVLEGTSLQPRWKQGVSGYWGWVEPIGADLDGDGHVDVVHRWFGGPDEMVVRSGADGSALWGSREWQWLTRLGDLDGDGLDDVVSVAHEADAEGNRRATLTRRKGSTGTPLLTTAHAYGDPEDDEWVSAWVGGDADADGIEDLLVTWNRIDCHESICDGGGLTSRGLVESGRTGAVLWQVEGNGWTGLDPTGDVDGDGKADYGWAAGDPAGGWKVSLRRGSDGAVVWERPTDESTWLRPVGDLDGDGLGDLLLAAWEGSVLSAVRGRDGHELWTHG